jgi:hypothetical protein
VFKILSREIICTSLNEPSSLSSFLLLRGAANEEITKAMAVYSILLVYFHLNQL